VFYLVIFAILAMAAPVVYANLRPATNRKSAERILFYGISSFFCTVFVMAVIAVIDSPALAAEAATTAATTGQTGIAAGLGFIGAGLTTMGSCIGSGIAVASTASAALGAVSEDGSMFGKSLIFVALAEAISLYGVLMSILILNKI